MPVSKVACVLMLYCLLVRAYPTDDNEGTDACLIGFPADGLAQFTGSVPATGSVTLLGQSPCPPNIVSNSPIVLESDDNIVFKENDEPCTKIFAENYENYYNNEIPKEVILGALFAGVITAVKGAEINATLAEIDSFIETELQNIGQLIERSVANTDTSEVDRCVESALTEIETQITTEVGVLDDFIESELTRTETLVDSYKPQKTTPNIAHEETLKQIELGLLQTLVDSLLAKTESVVNSELDKMNALVESELAKVDSIVKEELDKVDLFVEMELGKIKAELAKVGSILKAKLAKVEIPKKYTECGVAPTTKATITENCECRPVLNNENCNVDGENVPKSYEDPTITYVDVCGTFPVTGRTVIFGHTGCPPVVPTSEPLPLYVESFPVSTTDICDLCDHQLSLPYEDGVMSPMVRSFNNIIQNGESEAVLTTMRTLPAVNLPRNRVPTGEDQDSETVGTVEFCGTARARGTARLFNHFPCPPLPTQIGPDGKKYIWIAPPKPKGSTPKPSCPTYPTDCPTTIMDS